MVVPYLLIKLCTFQIWVGTKDGIIFIVNMITREVQKQLKAHSDVIRSMCTAQTRYVMSGSGSQDGKIAIWRTSAAWEAWGPFYYNMV